MRLKRKKGKQLIVPPGSFAMFPDGSTKGFLVDKKFRKQVSGIPWRYNPKTHRVRGYFGKGQTRQYLHKYVLTLARKHYPEATFDNGDWWDCRIDNLRPYDREEDGARRKPFGKKRRKGVIWHKRRKKFIAMIRVRGKLKHLGYFATGDLAARAYAKAWNTAHPNADPIPL